MNFVACFVFSLLVTIGNTADESTVVTDCVTEPKYPPEKTQIKQLGPFQRCLTEMAGFGNISTFSQSPNYTIMYINSPGADRGIAYSNELLCRWHVRCPDNKLLYYDITQHVLEPSVQSNIFNKPVCVDYLKLYRDYGTEMTCGFKEASSDMEPNKLIVEFRSNKKLRFSGFAMRLVCFEPSLQSQEGCSTSGSSVRSKRGSGNSTEQVDDKSEGIILATTKLTETALQQDVPSHSYLRFQSGTVQILGLKRNVETFSGIQHLVTFNQVNGVNVFLASNTSLTMRGFGVLTVINDTAYYTTFGIDPKFAPSSEEKEKIRYFLQASETMLKNTTTSNGDQRNQNKRASLISDSIASNAVQSSLNSCNAVLKSVAQLYFELFAR